MSDIPSFPYSLLWEERSICSVANLTRRDGDELFTLAPKIPIRIEVHTFSLEQSIQAFDLLRSGSLTGAAVIDFKLPAV
jgi:propanol-preferring alcohol dehydrogenase